MEKDIIYKKIGRNIQRHRKQAGLTQNQLAERISRSEDAVSNIERGSSAPPPETAILIAQALGIQLTDLYDLNITGKHIPQDLKDFLRQLRQKMLDIPENKRNKIHNLFDQIIDITDKT